MARKDDVGREGEQRAAAYLIDQGYEVLDRNWRLSTAGELDLVARRGSRLAVVEVKTRSSVAFGHPLEAIDDRKLDRLWRLACAWRREHPELAAGARLRIDAIAITGPDPSTAPLEHLRDLR
ncbi:MAG: YraN family protein [Microbacterium sp.]